MVNKINRKQFLQTSVGAAIATVVAGKLPALAVEHTIAPILR